MNRIIIFDFDGVLADSLDSLFALNLEAAKEIGKSLTQEQYLSGFEGHINERLADALDLTDDEQDRFVSEKARLFSQYANHETIKLFDFAEQMVMDASVLGELWIASSSPCEVIKDILNEKNLLQYFTVINGKIREPKELFFRRALAEHVDEEVFFITDTVGDIKAAKKTGHKIHLLAVSWGYHHSKLLLNEAPDLFATESGQVLEYIKSH